jgi:endonuclease/exonuclease/phosphatase family metal-dependent hydrolase
VRTTPAYARSLVRVLTWNLFHGRSVPGARRDLLAEFAARLAAWEWEVALLQEVPPWWPPRLASAAEAEQRSALTSRNAGLTFRRALAERWPDLIKSNGGGCNAVLSRVAIVEHRAIALRTWPERRVGQLVRLADGTVVANLHASTRVALAERELAELWRRACEWAAAAPLVLGGDLNLRSPRLPEHAMQCVASRDVDHLFARRLRACGQAEVLDRTAPMERRAVELSDHPPLAVTLQP